MLFLDLKSKENKGILFIFFYAIIYGVYMVLVNKGTRHINPILFASLVNLSATLWFLVCFKFQKLRLLSLKKNKKPYLYLLLVTFFSSIIPSILFFLGTSKTSGINTSLLSLFEVIFAILITPLFGEKNSKEKILGAFGIFIGGCLILYNGTLKINVGDILIIFSSFFNPFGNFYAKKALHTFSTSYIWLFRVLFSSVFLFLLSLFFENNTNLVSSIRENLVSIFFIGIITIGIAKTLWYEAFKRLDISKTMILGNSSCLFSLIILALFFKEYPSTYQVFGILIMAIGIFYSVKRKSIKEELTKYKKSSGFTPDKSSKEVL